MTITFCYFHILTFFFNYQQNDLKLMFTLLADNKYIALQKLAEAVERPETEQIQVLLIEHFYILKDGERYGMMNTKTLLRR